MIVTVTTTTTTTMMMMAMMILMAMIVTCVRVKGVSRQANQVKTRAVTGVGPSVLH